LRADPLERPIFIVAPPRSGARLLAGAFGAVPGTWTLGAGQLFAGLPDLEPPDGRRAGRLTAADCTQEVRGQLRARLQIAFAAGEPGAPRSAASRLVEAAPRNALIVPFLRRAFPDATFVYVHRRPLDALAESLAIWRAGSATTYRRLPGWDGPPWSFLLVPGWQGLIGAPLAEVVTEQWVRTMRALTADLERLPPASWCVSDRDALVANPAGELARLLGFLGLPGLTQPVALVEAQLPALDAADLDGVRGELAPYLDRAVELARRARDWSAD